MKQPFRFPRKYRLIRSLMRESDRGAVLSGAAYLDNDVKKLLIAAFRSKSDGSNEEIKNLLDNGGNAPLQSFGVRIKLARLMGLITSVESRALKKVQDIRNKFAHWEDVDTITPSMVEGLKAILGEHPVKFPHIEYPEGLSISLPRCDFVIAVACLHSTLRAALRVYKRFNPKVRRKPVGKQKGKPRSGHQPKADPKPPEAT